MVPGFSCSAHINHRAQQPIHYSNTPFLGNCTGELPSAGAQSLCRVHPNGCTPLRKATPHSQSAHTAAPHQPHLSSWEQQGLALQQPMDVLAEEDTVLSHHCMGTAQQRRVYCWIFTWHPRKRTCLLQRIKSFVLRKDPEILLKAKCCDVPCYTHVENQVLFPKAAEDVGEPGLQLKAQQEDAQRRSLLFPSILHFSILAAFIMLQIVLATVPPPLMFIQSNC